ncbi:TIGR03086 family metal-binding protein [Rhodococcus sp. RD6.2]|uniref:TIGR03086 family metal-binding protein n=1 Tax=Rhodococcus sp. RD6.2 TaxID=260936 RepID=UPI000679191B|nr:TIGR03086 family metal-binding protein [Rhodococcus sp. RD6.2]
MTDTSAVADRYRRLANHLADTVAAVPADRWDSTSPCEGWTARDVLQHVIDVQSMPLTPVGLSLPPAPAVDDDPLGAWTATRDAVQAILDDPRHANLEYDSSMGRTTAAATFDAFICFDLAIHRWDIARATGADETIPAEELAAAAALADRMGDMIRSSGVCGPVVEVPADADEQTRVLGRLGRRA